MADQNPDRHVEVTEDGRILGVADVSPVGDATVRAHLRVVAGHHPVGIGARLVDAMLELPEARDGGRLEATVAAGDIESLDRLRARCGDVRTRPAGASCLVDATLPVDLPADRYAPPAGGARTA
jgi:hypothetical protein